MYPAMPWLGLSVAYRIHKLTQYFSSNRLCLRPTAFATVVVIFTTLSALRSNVWIDAYGIAQNALRRYP